MKYLSRILASNHRSDGIHVLCYSEAWGQGGVETFLMSIFRRWQGKGFYFTLFSCWDWNLALDAELEALGIDRFTVFPDSKPGQVKRLCEGSAAFGALINEIRPDAVYQTPCHTALRAESTRSTPCLGLLGISVRQYAKLHHR